MEEKIEAMRPDSVYKPELTRLGGRELLKLPSDHQLPKVGRLSRQILRLAVNLGGPETANQQMAA